MPAKDLLDDRPVTRPEDLDHAMGDAEARRMLLEEPEQVLAGLYVRRKPSSVLTSLGQLDGPGQASVIALIVGIRPRGGRRGCPVLAINGTVH